MYTSRFMVEINDDELIRTIADGYSPEDVFPISELESWAEENGYTKKEEE